MRRSKRDIIIARVRGDGDLPKDEVQELTGGLLVTYLRTRKGYSLRQLSEVTGIPASHLSEMERGKRTIGYKMAARFRKVWPYVAYGKWLQKTQRRKRAGRPDAK